MAINTDTPRPLFPLALAFISGIAVFDYLRLPTAWLLPITVAIALFFIITLIIKSLRHSFASDILIIGLCFLAGAARLFVAQEVPANHIARFPHDDVPIYLEGVVTDEPVYYQPKNEFLAGGKNDLAGSFTINAETLAWSVQSDIVSGLVRVSFYGLDRKDELPQVKYGNRLRMLGKIYSPRQPSNPGEFDYGQFLKRQGIYKTLRIKSPDNIKLLAQGQGSWFWSGLQRFRNFLADKTDEYFGPEQAGLLKALILGERPAVPDTIETDFMHTGTIHILSVSGLHLAMVAGFLFLLLGGLGVTGRNRAILLIISSILYAVLTGLSTPVTRSLVMITVYFGSEIFIRKSNPFNSIALAGLIITAYNPNEVFSVGFQLSFLSVIAIVSFTPSLLALMRYKDIGTDIPDFVPLTIRERLAVILKKYLVNAVAVSVAATLGVFPLVLMYFHLITPVSILANIVLSPLVFLIMLFGFINMPLVGLGVYSWFVPLLAGLTRAMVWLVDLFSRIPYAYFYLPDIPQVFIWVFYGVFLLWLFRRPSCHSVLDTESRIDREANPVISEKYLDSRFRGNDIKSGTGMTPWKRLISLNRKYFFSGALAFMLIWFSIWAFGTQALHKQDGLTLTMLDVRQGASFVIQTPTGKTILYDCGTFGSRDVGEQVVSPFLWNKGITKIDKLILSHSHLDHINGVPSILERFKVKKVMTSMYFIGDNWGKRIEYEMDKNNMPIEAFQGIGQDDVIALDSMVTAEVLSPKKPIIIWPWTADDNNDLSVVLKIKYRNKAILLTGDIQAEGLKALLNSDKDLSADILQIPHHGFAIKLTNGQNSQNYLEELINRVNPSEIVINTDGDEIDEVILELCRARDIIIHSSDKDGAVAINLR